MALYDALTGLNNRRSLERRLPAMIETTRQQGAPALYLSKAAGRNRVTQDAA